MYEWLPRNSVEEGAAEYHRPPGSKRVYKQVQYHQATSAGNQHPALPLPDRAATARRPCAGLSRSTTGPGRLVGQSTGTGATNVPGLALLPQQVAGVGIVHGFKAGMQLELVQNIVDVILDRLRLNREPLRDFFVG